MNDTPPSTASHPDAPPRPDRRRWFALAVLCLSLLLIVVDNTIVNVALPTLQRELGATTSQLQWIVDSYILVFAGLLLTAGSLGDRFGRKRALTLGLLLMAAASGLSAVSGTAGQLIATRAMLGVGAALVMPATLSILTNIFTDAVERARAIAIWAGTAGMAVAIGPVTGGWLLQDYWWGAVFLVNIPVIAIALAAGVRLLPESRDEQAPPLDGVGALLSIAGLTTLIWTIIEAPDAGWASVQTLIGSAVAVVFLAGFVAWERRVEHPLLDVAFFRNARFSAASAAITLTFFAMFGSFFLMTQYLQLVLGFSALEAGVRLLPVAGAMMVIAPASAALVERLGTKVVVAGGLAITSTGLLLASFLTATGGYPPLAAVLVVLSVGMALTMAPATESIMGSLPRAKAGVGSAVNDTTRELGGALGVAVLGSTMASVYRERIGDALSGLALPAEVVEAAQESLGGAVFLASELGGAPAAGLVDAARVAFVSGMGTSFVVGAGAALLGAVIAYLALPARAASATDADDPVLDVTVVGGAESAPA